MGGDVATETNLSPARASLPGLSLAIKCNNGSLWFSNHNMGLLGLQKTILTFCTLEAAKSP